MTIIEIMVLAAFVVLVTVISGLLGHFLGFAPWFLALPVVVLGLWRMLGGRWITAAASIAIGAIGGLSCDPSWWQPPASAGAVFFLLRLFGARLATEGSPSSRRKCIEDDEQG